MKLDKILVATDFSPTSKRTLEHAAALASRHDAELHVLHVHVLQADWYGWNAKPDLANVDDIIEAAANKNMQNLVGQQGVRIVHSVLRDTRAAPAIVRYAEARDIDLIVTGTHARPAGGDAILGSVAAEVVRTSKVPTLVVKRDHALPAQGYRNMLVSVDLGPGSPALLHAAAEWAQGGQLQVVHVVETHNLPACYVGDFLQDQKAHAERALRAMIADVGLPTDTPARVLGGTTHERLVALAEKAEIDLIVMGQARLSAVGRWMLGSTTRRVLRRAPCPVLAWRASADDQSA